MAEPEDLVTAKLQIAAASHDRGALRTVGPGPPVTGEVPAALDLQDHTPTSIVMTYGVVQPSTRYGQRGGRRTRLSSKDLLVWHRLVSSTPKP